MRVRLSMALFVLLVAGCVVPKKRHLELQAELDSTMADRERRVADAEATVAALTDEVAGLEDQIRVLDKKLADSEAALASSEENARDLQGRNASILSDKGALRAEVDSMKAALAVLEARRVAADARLAEFKSLLARFQKLIDAGTLQVKIVDGRMVVAMATDVLFPSGSATLSAEGKVALTEVGEILKTIPDRSFQIEGHTDDVPIATAQFPSNWHLASARALNVVSHLLEAGMVPERLSGASFGEFHPVAANDTPENKSLNRRIEIVVVPDLSQLPGYDELQAVQ